MKSPKSILAIARSKIIPPPIRRNPGSFPYVTLSYAQSLDGSIAGRPGRPFALSGNESMRMTHRLRALHDGILVGIGTILADNPHLTVRLTNGRSPQAIITDSRLRISLDAHVVRSQRPPWIISSQEFDPERKRNLTEAGLTVIHVPSHADGLIDLTILLRVLRSRGIGSLMVEGGSAIITSFLRNRLVDQIILTLSPVLIGGMQAIWPLQLDTADPPRLQNVDYALFGPDLVVRADLNWKEA